MVSFGVFCAIMIPLCGLIGLATATIGFTAFMLVVPVCFVGFKMTVFESIFASVCLDFVDSALLVALAVYSAPKAKTSAEACSATAPSRSPPSPPSPPPPLAPVLLCVTLPALAGACAALGFSETVLDAVQGRLKSGLGYLLFVLAIAFFAKGLKQRKHERRLAAVAEVAEASRLLRPLPISDSVSSSAACYSYANAADQASQVSRQAELTVTQFLCGLNHKHQMEEEEEGGDRSLCLRVTAILFVLLGSAASGAIAGLLGLGGGLNFVLILHVGFRMALPRATAAGCFVMVVLTATVLTGALGFQTLPLHLSWHNLFLSQRLPVMLLAGLLSTLAGHRFARGLKPSSLNLLVAMVLFAAATSATVEIVVFSKD